MVKLIRYIWAGVLAFVVSSCLDKLENENYVEEGIPVEARFSFTVADSPKIDSRTGQGPEVEKAVTSLYALAFDSNGARSGGGRITEFGSGKFTLSMKSGSNKTLYLIANYDKGTGKLKWNDREDEVDLDDISTLDEFKQLGYEHSEENGTLVDRTQFLMVGSISGFSVTPGGHPSTGVEPVKLKRVSAKITFEIRTKDDVNGTLKNLKFEPYYYMVNNIPQGTYLSEQASDWKANDSGNYNSMLREEGSEHRTLDQVDPAGLSSNFTFYLMENRLSPKKKITSADKHGEQGTVETLYALRERRDKGEEADNGYGQKYEQGPFTYAPEFGSYVIIYGRVTGIQNEDGMNPGAEVFADVYLTVHLGETGGSGDADNLEKVNNYLTRRNVQYTYNLTITGLHSMHMEVDVEEGEEAERRPGMEGDLVITDEGSFFELDAHYNVAVFRIDISQWGQSDRIPPVSWAYSTPFGKGMKGLETSAFNSSTGEILSGKEEELQTDLSNNDYKWIKFIINKENNYTGSGNIARWPGEDAYDGGGSSSVGKAPALGGSAKQTPWGKNVRVYDVNQLMNRLYQIYLTDKNHSIIETVDGKEMVTVTAYIDEFLYTYDPTKAYYKRPDRTIDTEEERGLWKKTINETSRWLYLATSSRFSPDGATTRAEAIVVFSQRPIYSIFNTSKSDLKMAWGTESMVENSGLKSVNGKPYTQMEGELPYQGLSESDMSHCDNAENGHPNSVWYLCKKGTLQWSNALDYDNGLKGKEHFKQVGMLKDAFQQLDYAPLMRNRDFNGNNQVDEEEICWYLGASRQLTGLVLGKYTVTRAQLYNPVERKLPDGKYQDVHIASSTYKASWNTQKPGNVPIKLYGRQEGAVGPASEDEGCYKYLYPYRCMRNLGGQSSASLPGQDFATGKEEGNEYIIDVSNMDRNSLRSPFINTILPQGLYERDAAGNSRPATRFAVLRKTETGVNADFLYFQSSPNKPGTHMQKIEDLIWFEQIKNETNLCPPGYRIPNMGELMLMHALNFNEFFRTDLNGDANGERPTVNSFYHVAKTKYSLGPATGSALVIDGENIAMSSGTGTKAHMSLYVRCVRDIE